MNYRNLSDRELLALTDTAVPSPALFAELCYRLNRHMQRNDRYHYAGAREEPLREDVYVR